MRYRAAAMCLALSLAGCAEATFEGRADDCRAVTCSNHGVCVAEQQGPRCVCEPGFAASGLTCAPLASCEPNPCTAPNRTACSLVEGAVACACDPGHREDGTGRCVAANLCDPNPCVEPHRTSCRATGSTVTCSCEPGYWDNGECRPAVSCTPNPCTAPHRSVCSVDSGVVICSCEPGHRDDGAGRCEAIDPCVPNPCREANRTTCQSQGAAAVCSCDPGYWDHGACVPAVSCSPNPCTAAHRSVCALDGASLVCGCDPGYREDGAGGCVLVAPCDPNPCVEEHRTVCVDAGGVAVCGCEPGYWDHGVCVPAVACTPNPCTGPHKTACSILEGAVACACDPGYRDDGAGGCAPLDPCVPNPCTEAHRGACRAAGATAICSCDEGYRDDGQGACVAACDPNPCQAPNQQICSPAPGGYRCACSEGYVPNTSGVGCQYDSPPDCGIAHPTGDSYEPDECPSLARTLDLSAMQAHTIAGPGDVDWLTFPTQDAMAYLIEVTPSGLKLDVSARDAGGVKVLAAGSSSSKLTLALTPGAGRVLVRISAAGGASTGAYSVSVVALADDFANSADSAFPLAVPPGAANGRLDYTGDVDWFRFSASAGRIYRFSLTSNTWIYGDLYSQTSALSTPLGSSILYASTYTAGTVVRGWVCPMSGTYYLRVRPDYDHLGTYSVQIEELGADDYPETAAAAPLIPAGATSQGNLQYGGDIDWLSFAGVPGHIYRVKVTASTSLEGRLYDSSALSSTSPYPLATSNGKTLDLRARLTIAGRLYVRLSGYFSDTESNYEVTLEDLGPDDFADTSVDATSIALGSTVNGVLQLDADTDWFSIRLTPGRIYQADISPTASRLALIGPDGTTVLRSPTAGTLVFSASVEGPYFLAVSSSYYAPPGPYSLYVTDIGADEHGSSADTAFPLSIGAATPAALDFSGDADWFSFPATALHIYRITIIPSGLNLRTRLLAGSTLLREAIAATKIEILHRPAAAGALLVSVAAYSGTSDTGAYLLLVEDLGSDDHGDAPTSATVLAVGTPTSGSVQFEHDVDWYSLTTTGGHVHQLKITPLGLSVRARLIGSDGHTELASQNSFSPIALPFLASGAGPYYLAVSSPYPTSTGSYLVEAEDLGADDHGGTQASATPLTLGAAAMAGSIQFADDMDVFAFEAAAGSLTLNLTLTGPLQTAVSVTGTSTGVVTTVTGPGSATLTVPSAGTWFLHVTALTSGQTGSYALQLAP